MLAATRPWYHHPTPQAAQSSGQQLATSSRPHEATKRHSPSSSPCCQQEECWGCPLPFVVSAKSWLHTPSHNPLSAAVMSSHPGRKLEATPLPLPITPFCCLGGAKLSRGCWQPNLGGPGDLGVSDPTCKWFLLGPRNLETDNGNSLGKESERGDTFRRPNMLRRKSPKAPTSIPRHAHKYKLFTICPTAAGHPRTWAVSPFPQQCQNQDL